MNFKQILNEKKGITLIALVITIIVLIILSVVSINILFNENGLFGVAKMAREKSKEGEVRDEITTAWAAAGIEVAINELGTAEKASALQTKLKEKDSSATASLSGANIKVKYRGFEAIINPEAGITSITKDEIDPNALTVGKAYDQTLIKIGDPFTYTGDTQTEWIVFGKDENGDVLLTTAEPVTDRGFRVTSDAEHWAKYETDLHTHCSIYGNDAKGITSRSIKMEDINRVTGYVEPIFIPITLGLGTGEQRCYYPSLDAENYVTDTTANPKVYKWWKYPSESKTFTRDEIYSPYTYQVGGGIYDNMEYVVGVSRTRLFYGKL